MKCIEAEVIELKSTDDISSYRFKACEAINNRESYEISVPTIDREDYFNNSVFCKTENDLKHSPIQQNMNCLNSTSFEVINVWYGVVTDVYDASFESEILDIETSNDELISFDFNEIPKDDQGLIEEGATFQFYLGYHYSEFGQKVRSTMLIFDRYTSIPTHKKSYKEIDNYRLIAEKLMLK